MILLIQENNKMKLADTSVAKVVSAVAVFGMVMAYCYVCIKTSSLVDIPQSYVIVLGLLLSIEAVPQIKKKLDEKQNKTYDGK
jgi:hypothetical protein